MPHNSMYSLNTVALQPSITVTGMAQLAQRQERPFPREPDGRWREKDLCGQFSESSSKFLEYFHGWQQRTNWSWYWY